MSLYYGDNILLSVVVPDAGVGLGCTIGVVDDVPPGSTVGRVTPPVDDAAEVVADGVSICSCAMVGSGFTVGGFDVT